LGGSGAQQSRLESPERDGEHFLIDAERWKTWPVDAGLTTSR
jgi:hypothetical protein